MYLSIIVPICPVDISQDKLDFELLLALEGKSVDQISWQSTQ